MQRAAELGQDLRTSADLRDPEQQRDVFGRESERSDLSLDADEVAVDQLLEDSLARGLRDVERLQEGRVERGVADPDPVGLKPGGIEGLAEHGERLRGPFRPG